MASDLLLTGLQALSTDGSVGGNNAINAQALQRFQGSHPAVSHLNQAIFSAKPVSGLHAFPDLHDSAQYGFKGILVLKLMEIRNVRTTHIDNKIVHPHDKLP